MLDYQIKPQTSEQRVLYELNGGILTVYCLSIKKSYRFHRIAPKIFSIVPEDTFYAQTIQGGWNKKPLEDLLDKNNRAARTTISITKLNSMRSKCVRGTYSSFKLYRCWKDDCYNLSSIARHIGPQNMQAREREGLDNFLDGKNTYQPIRIIDNRNPSNINSSTILLPTSGYTQIKKRNSKGIVEIMPGIIKLPASIYLSHLVDIEDYDRFIQDEYVTESDRINAFNNYTVSTNDFPLAAFPLDEQEKIKAKARRDSRIIDVFKRSQKIS